MPIDKLEKLSIILENNGVSVFEYIPSRDHLIIYDKHLESIREIPDYLTYLETENEIHPDDRWKAIEFYKGNIADSLEVRTMSPDGRRFRKILNAVKVPGDDTAPEIILGSVKDITATKKREELLLKQSQRDNMTMLYNHNSGKELVNDYLNQKSPYASCGLIIVDVDYFKNVNDNYGHLFGDKVLIRLAHLFQEIFEEKDILIRAGGDEFVLFIKDIAHSVLVKKTMQLLNAIRQLSFPENNYSMTCSIGVCFLPENTSGYTYDQLFENADWALYRAKENGKNRYVFCDNLRRFELSAAEPQDKHPDIDARYLRNDIIATAFEVFEKFDNFQSAMSLLMEIIGIRFQLDRITVIETNLKSHEAQRQFQWTSKTAPETLPVPSSFTKEDFLTLFHSYDEYGTAVLQHDNMSMYSPGAAALLMQGGAKTVVYAGMYCDGKYTGAISYVVCSDKRFWSKQNRSQLGELTKLISAHLAKNHAMNISHHGIMASPDYDTLTGLLAFSRFHEEVERLIVGNKEQPYLMVYSDFKDFKYFNQKYGYTACDQILKDYTNHIIESLDMETDVYFTRVVADQFILFKRGVADEATLAYFEKTNQAFVQSQTKLFSEMYLRIRTGVYQVMPGCISTSAAIDAANYARKQLHGSKKHSVKLYDQSLDAQKKLENTIITGYDNAIQNHEFKIYLQPRYSLKDRTIVSAEALLRWEREDGTILYPDSFMPLYEENGRVVDLDFYVFEEVVSFLAKNN